MTQVLENFENKEYLLGIELSEQEVNFIMFLGNCFYKF